jgi:hypothetical protein
MRSHEMRAVYGLVLATIALALVVCVSVNSIESRNAMETELFQLASDTTMLKTDHYEPPNPLEDPELRPKYEVDVTKEESTSKADFADAMGSVKKGSDVLKPVLEKLKKQDEDRDKLMDEAITISDRVHRVRHLLINVKAETNGILTHDDGDWIFTNPFGKDADAPAQDVAPFEKQVKDLSAKCKDINKSLKDLIVRTHKARNAAIELDAHLYGQIQKAKHIVADANVEIRHHFDRVEMFNHKDYDHIHPIDAKLNNEYRVARHKFNGMVNLANAMSARQPNEVSEVTALATELLIVNAEGEERLKRMQDVIDNIKFERGFRAGSSSK